MGWVVNATSRPLYPRERPGTHCIGGWVGTRAGLDRCGKSRPPPGLDPRTFQSVASRYTEYAIPGQPAYPTTLIIFNFCCPYSGRLLGRYTVTADTVLRGRFRHGPRSTSSWTSSVQLIKSFYRFCSGVHQSYSMGRWWHLIIVL
jgi:hypothetical protein